MIDQETLNKFDKLYYDSYDYILKYVICNCSKITDVDDIIQNIYLELYKALIKNKDVDNYKTYIYGIAKNKVKDYYRFAYKDKIISFFSGREEIVDYNDLPSSVNIEKDYITKENINQIWDFLKGKKVIIFKIFYLYYDCGLNIKEISKELNLTESNVKHHLYRTLKELKELYGGGM